VERIYHTWDKWECYKAGFFEVRPPKHFTDEDCQERYATLLKDIEEFKRIMMIIIEEWVYSCQHNLTNDRMNRIAWMGQSALCYKFGIPARYRGGYNLLTIDEQNKADEAALEIINVWMLNNGYELQTVETIKSKTEANLY
jgi:hypothetical protein